MGDKYVIVIPGGKVDHLQSNKVTAEGYVAQCGVVGQLVRAEYGRGRLCRICKIDVKSDRI